MTIPSATLKVYYPFGGEHFLLLWRSYNEGHHIIVARSKEAAEQVFKEVINKYTDAKVKLFIKANVVAPNEEQHKAYSKTLWQQEVNNFTWYYVSIAKDYREENKTLPAGLKECNDFVSRYEEDDSEYNKEQHYSCKNCTDKINPVNGTFEEIYIKHRDTFLQNHNKWVDNKLVFSKGDSADPNKELFVVLPNFGHHKGGLDINEYDSRLHREPLLLYQDANNVDRSVVNSIIKDVEEQQEKRRNELEDLANKQFKERKEKEFEDLLSVFG